MYLLGHWARFVASGISLKSVVLYQPYISFIMFYHLHFSFWNNQTYCAWWAYGVVANQKICPETIFGYFPLSCHKTRNL